MKGNVMWMSDNFNAPSGFGQQTFHAVSRLTSGPNAIHVDNVAWQFLGNPVLLNDNLRVLPSAGRFASSILPHHVKIYKPDLFVTLADLWNVNYMLNMKREPHFSWIHWLPIDGIPIKHGMKWTSAYNAIDVIVAMSDFGERELIKGRKKWLEKNDREVPTVIEKIYHGIPTELYVPYDEDQRYELRKNYDWQEDFVWDTACRKKFVKGEEDLNDYFIFGIVARNQPRKNYPELLQAWAEFAELYKDVILWIHAIPNDPARKSGDLYYIVDQLGCADSVIFSDTISPWYGKSSKEMADVYNLFDCHFLPTAGEGFGIPTVEAMSCEVFTAITDFTTGNELIDQGRCGHIINHGRLEITPGSVMRAHILATEIIKDLEYIYNMSANERKRKARLARQRVIDKYDSTLMALKWWNLLQKYMPDESNPRTRTHDLKFHFDKRYMVTREMDSQTEYSKNEWRIIGRYLAENDTILEIGCGSGEGMIFLARNWSVIPTGNDIAEAAIKMCRKKGLNVYQHDANNHMPAEPYSYDVVYTQHVVEHLDNDVNAIVDSLRIAKKYAIHVVPHDNMRDPTHKRKYTADTVLKLVNDVVEEYTRLHLIWESSDVKLNTEVVKNYVGNKREDKYLVSYVMIFEKVE